MLAEQLDLYKKFTKDTILAGIANAALALRWLVLLPILSKTLGAEAYGIWSQLQVTVTLLILLGGLQLGFAMSRFLPAETDKSKTSTGFFSILSVTSVTSILLSILMFVLAEPLAAAVFGGVQAMLFVKLAAFLVLLTAIDQTIIDYLVAFRQMGRYSIFIIAQVAGEVALVAYLVSSGFGLYGAISALVVIRALLFVIGFLLVKRQIKFSAPSLSVVKPYLAFSLPLLPMGFGWWVYTLSDRYIIGYFLGIEAVGVYSAAHVLGTIIELFFFPLSIILLPAVTYAYENSKIEQVKTLLKYSLKFYLMVALPAVCGLSILAKPLLATLATPEYATGSLIVAIVALATVLLGSSGVISRVPILFKRTKIIGLIDGACAILNVVMNIILVPAMGILGAAIATLAAFMLRLTAISIISFRQLSFDVAPKFIAKALISSLIMGAVVWALSPTGAITILISVVVGAAIYFVALMLLRGFNRQEYEFLKDILRGVRS